MQIDVGINAESVEQYVANAVLESTLGDAVRKGCEKALAELEASFGGAMRRIIDTAVANYVKQLLETQFRDNIDERIKASALAGLRRP